MSMSFKEVDEILKIIDQFPVSEVRFEHRDLKLYVCRDKAALADTATASAQPSAKAVPAGAASLAPAAPVETAVPETPRKAKVEAVERKGMTAVSAPMMGVFYSAPAPDAPPFVTVGQQVAEGDDLCIIEVMKVMNLIKAPCAGVVDFVEAANAEMVERSQPLLWIRPAAGRRG